MTNSNLFFHLPNCIVAEISGEDRLRYIQGRITQDIKALQPAHVAGSLLLSPQGKIQSVFDIAALENSFLVVVEPMSFETFEDSLFRFKVADDVHLTELKDKTIVSVQGLDSKELLEQVFSCSLDETKLTNVSVAESEVIIYRKARSLDGGFDLVLNTSALDHLLGLLSDTTSLAAASQGQIDELRIRAGIVAMENELKKEVVATEIPYSNLISFTKGCYAGQETVEMSIARGRPNRTLLRLCSETGVQLSAESDVFLTSDSEKKIGVVTSAVVSKDSDKTYCLAFVKTKVAEESDFIVQKSKFTKVL